MSGLEALKEIKWSNIKYFTSSEFDSPDSPGSGVAMNMLFVAKLNAIRDMVGEPLRINSGYRTLPHNKAVGGVSDSAHTKGLAADIHCSSGELRAKVVHAASALGIRRIGIGPTIVHLDIDDTLPSPRIWLY